MTNSYLQTLELQPGASKNEIKAAYRRLSKKYHPDVNKDPNAHEQFVAINEAYKFLTDVGPSPHQETVAYDYDPYQQEYEERRRRARAYAYRQAQEAQRRQEASIKYMLKIFDSISYFIIIFNTLLSIDYVLPANSAKHQIIDIERVQEGRRAGGVRYRYDDIIFDEFRVRVDKGRLKGNINETAIVYSTPILSTYLSVDVRVNGIDLNLEQIYGIYAVFGLLIPAIFLIALIYRFVMKSIDHKFTLAIVMTGIFAFQVYMFLKF